MYDEIYQRLKKRKMGTWKEYFTFILMIRFSESINCWAEWNSILFISLLTQPGIVCFGKDLIPNGKHDYFVVVTQYFVVLNLNFCSRRTCPLYDLKHV